MSQPPAYTRQFDFTDFASDYPTTPLPGVSADAEFDAVKDTLDVLLTNIALLQRDDGALKNQIVSIDSLTPAALVVLGASASWTIKGAWLTATAYVASDVVTESGATYVCAVAHTSGTFSTDEASGYWVKIYDSAGSTPADASVTTAKLADGSVTAPKVGFTALDLTGTLRGQGGVASGTAPPGGLMHAKKDSGDVFVKSERDTDAQGAVGYQIIGVTVTWSAKQAAGDTGLELSCSALPYSTTLFAAGGYMDQLGAIRATGALLPTSGAGVAMHYASGIGYLSAYDYTGVLWKDLKIRGKDVYLTGSGVDIAKVSSTGMDIISGGLSKAGVEVGYLDVPQNEQSGAYTLALTDRGKHIKSVNVSGQTITVPPNSSVAFPIGTAIVILNDGSNPISIVRGSGVDMKLVGTGANGTRTLAVAGMCTLLKTASDGWWASGVGLT